MTRKKRMEIKRKSEFIRTEHEENGRKHVEILHCNKNSINCAYHFRKMIYKQSVRNIINKFSFNFSTSFL
jgi:hypothetical protein